MLMDKNHELPSFKNADFEADIDSRKTLQREANQSTSTAKIKAIHVIIDSSQEYEIECSRNQSLRRFIEQLQLKILK